MNATIYQGDALTILKTLPSSTVDAVVTDPPYSSGGVTLAARQANPAQKYQQSGTARTYPTLLGDGAVAVAESSRRTDSDSSSRRQDFA
jgi:site-specific DNA-methyltransferase (adenine-specific)